MKTPDIQNRSHSALDLDEGFIPVAVIATNGAALIVQIPPEVIDQLENRQVEKVLTVLRDAFYRVRPDLRKQ